MGNAGPIFSSLDGGVTWQPLTSPTNRWAGIACSADGTNLIAAAGTSSTTGGLYTSTDSGLNWSSNNIAPQRWRSVATSADGLKLFAVTADGKFYRTTNGGNEWVSNLAPNGSWSIACSADGESLVAAPGNFGGYICTSTNSGASWQTNTSVSARIWWSVASSADGNTMAAVDGSGGPSGHVFTSTNSGVTWKTNDVPLLSWQNVALSADGAKIVAAAWYSSGVPSGPIFTSTNSGLTWISNNLPNLVWQGVICSADGNMMGAISAGTNATSIGKGSIWISQTTPAPSLSLAPTNGLQLSWLIPSTNFVLQQSSDLANWSAVTNVPVLNLTNLQNQVTLPLSEGNAFFRLVTQ